MDCCDPACNTPQGGSFSRASLLTALNCPPAGRSFESNDFTEKAAAQALIDAAARKSMELELNSSWEFDSQWLSATRHEAADRAPPE